jgi:hypothetical protein
MKGRVTFLHGEALHSWVLVETEVELALLKRLDDFRTDDGRGAWLRERIRKTSEQAEMFAKDSGGDVVPADVQLLLAGSGFSFTDGAFQPPPLAAHHALW